MVTNGNLKSYKSYKFSDSEYNGTTITNMIEHYWSNISNQTYGIASFLNSSNAFSGTYYKHDNNNGFIIFSGQSPSYKTQKGIIMNGNWTWTSLVTNTDLTERFKPIRIFGTEGGTFSKALKNKVYNSVVFLAFDTSVPDNPFSFEAGYAIAFHAGLLKSENVFTLIGFDSNALHPLEIKMLDLRS